MKILLTGFGPFGVVKANPSEQAVKQIAARAGAASIDELVTAILPTEFSAAARKIRRLIRAIRPDAIVCVGVAASRRAISLERVALNVDDESLPDNAGSVRAGTPIVRGGPAAYFSTLPLTAMMAALKKRRIGASVSNHAGTYVCNHVFYVARHEVEKLKRPIACGFIHVPLARKHGEKSAQSTMSMDKIVNAVESCIAVLRKKRGGKFRVAAKTNPF